MKLEPWHSFLLAPFTPFDVTTLSHMSSRQPIETPESYSPDGQHARCFWCVLPPEGVEQLGSCARGCGGNACSSRGLAACSLQLQLPQRAQQLSAEVKQSGHSCSSSSSSSHHSTCNVSSCCAWRLGRRNVDLAGTFQAHLAGERV